MRPGQHPCYSEQADEWLVNTCALVKSLSPYRRARGNLSAIKQVSFYIGDNNTKCARFHSCSEILFVKETGLKVSRGKKRSAEGKPTKNRFFRLVLY